MGGLAGLVASAIVGPAAPILILTAGGAVTGGVLAGSKGDGIDGISPGPIKDKLTDKLRKIVLSQVRTLQDPSQKLRKVDFHFQEPVAGSRILSFH